MSSDVKIHRTTIEIEVSAFEGAREALGTAGYKETVNEALRAVSREICCVEAPARFAPAALA